ncbi:MAG: transposase [Eggerthellaceae bacterium]|nr:transposase [Eggerthellaceae bacterium]
MERGFDPRAEAAALFEAGYAERSTAGRLGLPVKMVKRWLYTYRAVGKEALLVSKRRRYDYDTKLAAARDVVERGAGKPQTMEKYGIASITALERWCRDYREGGAGALLPKPKGRPRKPEKPEYASREEELEARVRELELELEIQKRINALADGIERRSHRR